MNIYNNPDSNTLSELLKRPQIDYSNLYERVSGVLESVKKEGDAAIKRYTAQFDKVELSQFVVSDEEKKLALREVSDSLKLAIQTAANNIKRFHAAQLTNPEVIETMPGIQCWRKSVAIDKVGLYIPGGTAPLFSTVLMLGIPAVLAGCKNIILCSPPNASGNLHPAIIYAASVAGINNIYKVGGVQAIAAMAFGTATIPAVYKIFGPGNQYVTLAKQLIQQYGVAIDMPAGPSEVCVLADETANPGFIAADLLSQAEHGVDSQVLLVSTNTNFVNSVNTEIEKQLAVLPRKEMAAAALFNSKAIVVDTMDSAIDVVNEYAAEHLIVACNHAVTIAEKITNAGSVFIGNYSPESVGDYASGTNHTLPTNGYARAYSGVSVDSFVKKITFQQLSKEGLQNIGETVMQMAKAEGLEAHSRAVEVRVGKVGL